jgi:hypothetical protein
MSAVSSASISPDKLAEEGLPEDYQAPTPGNWEDYPLDELAIRDERRTAIDVVRRIRQDRFVLDPDFQRDFVWSLQKQSRLIESILMRIPLPVFYVAEDARGRLIVVDGLQRLTTLTRFLSGELALDLPDRPELHGKRHTQLEIRLQNRVEDCQLLFYIIEHSVPEQARLDIFERVNGGEPLTRQQMRNAIYNGPATVLLREEASSDLFLTTTGGSLNAKKMQDREFVNRFCSFSLLPLAKYQNMDDWLAKGLKLLNDEPARISEIGPRFHRALHNNYSIFGKHAFRKHKKPDQPRSVINASLFDVMSIGLARYDAETVNARAEQMQQAFYRLMDDAVFIKAITYGPNTPKEVRKRFELGEQMFEEVFGDL